MLAFRNCSIKSFSCCLVLLVCLTHNASARRSAMRKQGDQMPKERQKDDVDSGSHDDLNSNNDPYECTRICKEGEKPRVCYYDFHYEFYYVLTRACGDCPNTQKDCFLPQCVPADGFEKTVISVNRKISAPSIQVCKGDTIVVDVHNQMPGTSTSIHWHGQHQHLTPWFDGVPLVTQCPILEAQIFQYRFVAEEPGTHFYHPHDGLQKVDGPVGSFIVREPDSQNPIRHLYDFDLPSHVMVIQDWMHEFSLDLFPGATGEHRQDNIGQHPDSYLINGHGVFPLPEDCLNCAFNASMTPVSIFTVTSGSTYRFRIIAGTCLSCPFAISIQDHELTVINADETPMKPQGPFDSLTMNAAQRFDVLVNANQPVGNYIIYVRGFDECENGRQVALLRYEGADPNALPAEYAPEDEGYTFNLHNDPCDGTGNGICFFEAESFVRNPPRVRQKPDKFQILYFGFYQFPDEELFLENEFKPFYVPAKDLDFAGFVNNVSQAIAPSPVLTQYHDIPPEIFCVNRPSCNGQQFCECLNYIQFNVNDLVEFVIVDTKEGARTVTHPFHVHGHFFYIVEQGIFPTSYKEDLDDLLRRLRDPNRVVPDHLPQQDTVQVPSVGYAVVRTIMDNPGTWLYHCHFNYHSTVGMETIFQVGPFNNRLAEVPPDFPKCHSYEPPFNPEPIVSQPEIVVQPVKIVHPEIVVHREIVHPEILVHPEIVHPEIVHPEIVHPEIVHPEVVPHRVHHPGYNFLHVG